MLEAELLRFVCLHVVDVEKCPMRDTLDVEELVQGGLSRANLTRIDDGGTLVSAAPPVTCSCLDFEPLLLRNASTNPRTPYGENSSAPASARPSQCVEEMVKSFDCELHDQRLMPISTSTVVHLHDSPCTSRWILRKRVST